MLMPKVEVEDAGTLSLPVPDSQPATLMRQADRGRRGQVRKTDAPGEPGIGGRRERPRPSAGRAGAPESPAPFRPPLVPIGWRIQDRLRGLARPLSDESALVTILDLDATTKPAVFAEPDAATPAYRIVFPGAFPSE